MNQRCDHCKALAFYNESFHCCHSGKVKLDALTKYPDELRILLTGKSSQAINYQKNIRQYNSAFAFASMGATLANPPGRGPPSFRICGQIFHGSGCLHPRDGQIPTYNQLYIYLLAYRNMADVEKSELSMTVINECQQSTITMQFRIGKDRRRYNMQHHDEVAVVFVGDDGAPPMDRYIIYPRNQPLQRISYMSANCDPMIYPLLFPRGDPGWRCGLTHVEQYSTVKRNRVTMLQFYTYRLAITKDHNQFTIARNYFNNTWLMPM